MNNIDYFLSGKALLQAIKYGDFVDINSPVDIIVTTNNAKKLIDCLENVLNLSNCILKTHTDFSFRKSYIYLDIYPVDQDYMKVCSIKLNLKKSLNRNIPALEKSVNILHGGYNENKVFIYRECQ